MNVISRIICFKYSFMRTITLLSTILVSFCFFSQTISQEEQKLYEKIMEYRASKGLGLIPLSGSLTIVAQTHVKDLKNNNPTNNLCNMHSWSSNGSWSSCCYTSDHKQASCMWNKPKELTSYLGSGYEIAFGSSNAKITAEDALNGWKNSSGHNAVIINQGVWTNKIWKAIGIGITDGYAAVWFGEDLDYAETPIIVQNTIENKVVSSNSKCGGSTSNSTTTTNTYNTQSELSELKSKVSLLNSEVAEKEGTIAKLNREVATLSSEKYQLDAAKTNLTNSVNSLQQQYAQKDAQYNKLKEEFNELSDRRTSVRKSKYNADEFHALTFKIGLNTFYPSINPISLGKFNMNVLSFGAETMLGVNFGDSYRRNSLGITLRANQANRFLTKALDSSATQPIQFYDAELTTLIREWLSIGIGASFISSYGSPIYQITPSASLGLCLGPKNWKIQLTQQASVNSDKKIIGRASLGLALRL
jgi:uncharacterized coiled-coil protein SlyX